MLEVKEMKLLSKIVNKPKIDSIKSQQIRESCDIEPINEWMERRKRALDEHETRMDVKRIVKMSRDNYRRKFSRSSEKKMERINPRLKQAELSTITKKKKKKKMMKKKKHLNILQSYCHGRRNVGFDPWQGRN